jgi:hypothetical protein
MGFLDDVQRAYATFNRLNASEKDAMWDAVTANPNNAFVLKEAKEEAESWARTLAGTFTDGLPADQVKARFQASVHNGPADAARHCYWSALLASKLTYNEAMRVVFTHEFDQIDSGVAQDKLEARMDLHNDRAGLEIGIRNKGASDLTLRDEVMKALFSGQLRCIDPKTSTLVPTRSLVPSI